MPKKRKVCVLLSFHPMHNPELPVATAIAAVLLLIPAPTQFRLRNIPVLALLGGSFFLNVIYLVNTLVWAGNVRDVAPVWCDIATNIQFYFPLLAEGAALCISRRLKWIWAMDGSRPRHIYFEISMCFIVPLVSIPIRYSLSSNRYVIMENFGCFPGFYLSALTVGLMFGSYLVVSFVCFVLCCLSVQNLIHRRQTSISASFRIAQSAFTTSHFFRLLAVCGVVGTWPLIADLICLQSFSLKILPQRGWTAVHAHFGNIPRIPLLVQPPELRQVFLTVIWVDIVTSYLVFVILIFTEGVRRDLDNAWRFVSHLASSFWQRCVAALTRRPRAPDPAPAPSSQWFDSSSSGSGSNGNALKMMVAATAGRIVPGVKKALVSRHDQYPSADGDLDTHRHLFPGRRTSNV